MAKNNIYFYSLLLLLLFSCKYRVVIETSPQDSIISIDNNNIKSNSLFKTDKKIITVIVKREGYKDLSINFQNKSLFKTNKYYIKLEKKKFNITISTVDNKSKIVIDNGNENSLPFNTTLDYGAHLVKLLQKDYFSQEFEVFVKKDCKYKFRHQKEKISEEINLIPLGIIECGRQPKQVNFSLDDKYIFVSLLDDIGFDIINMQDLSLLKRVEVENSDKKGYVEGLFVNNSYFISQMTTGNIYEFDVSDIENIKYKRKINTKGLWTKVIAYSKVKDILATSNWCSNDISIIENSNGNIVQKISNIIVPRGIIFSNDGTYLYATSFEGGEIIKYKTDDWSIESKISFLGAPRHIVLNRDNTLCYVSDMAYNAVYEIDTTNFKILNTIKVYSNPNTIDITPDDKYLFVSNRGPNNPKGYLERGIENGKIAIIDCSIKKIVGWINGGLQPTGLDISNNGKFLAFSNFQDNNVEIYKIEYITK